MLRNILRLNAFSCLVFGSLFVFFHEGTYGFLKTQSLYFSVPSLGAILLIFAFHLIAASFRKDLIKGEVYYFSFGDFLWVFLSIALMSSTEIVTSHAGLWAGFLVALMVGGFGMAQLLLAKKLPKDKVSVSLPLKHSKEVLWSRLSDFENIDQHHPMVQESKLLNSSPKMGIGAKRQCTFQDGSQVHEEVVDWVEGEAFEVRVLGMNMPLSDLTNRVSITEDLITVSSSFRGKGFFSELLIGFLMRPLLKRKLKEVASGFNS